MTPRTSTRVRTGPFFHGPLLRAVRTVGPPGRAALEGADVCAGASALGYRQLRVGGVDGGAAGARHSVGAERGGRGLVGGVDGAGARHVVVEVEATRRRAAVDGLGGVLHQVVAKRAAARG